MVLKFACRVIVSIENNFHTATAVVILGHNFVLMFFFVYLQWNISSKYEVFNFCGSWSSYIRVLLILLYILVF